MVPVETIKNIFMNVFLVILTWLAVCRLFVVHSLPPPFVPCLLCLRARNEALFGRGFPAVDKILPGETNLDFPGSKTDGLVDCPGRFISPFLYLFWGPGVPRGWFVLAIY
ncbi:hypothetical protein IEQ34_012582 [Dendrobium chrysotoxum]|uniref:Uncharacterized protein n=1 Tax=Dendrobium chrysotoxum TaxID=161865 RepID=A0AAV7GVU8_DENCH|nr:hypothetical protein IEQ34_012582 [Dendrobium chrysotoxum]